MTKRLIVLWLSMSAAQKGTPKVSLLLLRLERKSILLLNEWELERFREILSSNMCWTWPIFQSLVFPVLHYTDVG